MKFETLLNSSQVGDWRDVPHSEVGPVQENTMAATDNVEQQQKEEETLLSRPADHTIMGEIVKTRETFESEEEEKNNGKYPWPLLVRTVLLLNAFLALGINDAIGGPTLLDLRLGSNFKGHIDFQYLQGPRWSDNSKDLLHICS